MRHLSLILSVLMVLGMVTISPANADTGFNMKHLQNIPFPDLTSGAQGTDSDFIDMDIDTGDGVDVRTVGVFGSIYGGARILDVTDGMPVELGFYGCAIGQGDIQIFQRGDRDPETGEILDLDAAKTYFTSTDDGYGSRGGECQNWAQSNGKFDTTKQGTFIIDITDPTAPTPVQFVPFPKGSHNMTVHPSTNYLYNSNSELITNAVAAGIEIYDITDLAAPVQLPTLALDVRPGLGTDSHDLTFNAEGTRAYSAALSQTVIINTEDPANPSIITSFMDPAINVEHQANPVTIDDPLLGTREFLIVEDEFGGAAGAEQTCPSGGTHVYDITGELEIAPIKVGSWYIDDVTTNAAVLGRCTAHVFDIHEDSALMTMSFYNAGVRVIDISGLVGLSLGANGVGMREIGAHRFTSSDDGGVSDSWSIKTPQVDIAEDGTISAFMYSNDVNRGIDVYEFSGSRADVINAPMGQWFAGNSWVEEFGPATMPATYKPFCLLGNREAPAAGASSLIATI